MVNIQRQQKVPYTASEKPLDAHTNNEGNKNTYPIVFPATKFWLIDFNNFANATNRISVFDHNRGTDFPQKLDHINRGPWADSHFACHLHMIGKS